MKNICYVLVALSVLLMVQGIMALDAKDILNKSDEKESYDYMYAETEQIIATSSGSKRTLVIRNWATENGREQLSEYLEPADIRGQKILMTDDGDNIWMFNAETKRTRKLGSHMKKKKVMGSDFTYEDQAGGKMSEKYTPKLLKEEALDGAPCYLLELVPTANGPSYAKVLAWIGKEDFLIRRVDFYNEGDSSAFKKMVLSDFRQAGSRMTPFKIVMTGIKDRSETVTLIKSVVYDQKIPQSVFDPRELEK